MTAATVRAAIQTFLRAASVPGLNQVNRAPVIVTDPTTSLGGAPAGASGYVWLESNDEAALSVGGATGTAPNGWRLVSYNAALIFDYYVLANSTSDDTWADGLDAMTDAVKVALRSDPTLGTTGQGQLTIFRSADEFPSQDPSIRVVLGEPQLVEDSQSFLVHGAVVFPVHETIPPG